jgi:hypothetical protein
MANNLTPNRGVLYTNHKKSMAKHPDYQGEFMTEDGKVIRLSAWRKETPRGLLISLAKDSFVRKDKSTKDINTPSEDDIPF